MGEIADAILNGDLDEETGEWIGLGQGFPRSRQREAREHAERRASSPKRFACPDCTRRFRSLAAVGDHRRDVHGEDRQESAVEVRS